VGEPLNPGRPLNVGIIGCGTIVGQYLASLRRLSQGGIRAGNLE